MTASPYPDWFLAIVGQHVLAHTLLALILMGLVCALLQWFRVVGFAWHAAAYVSLFFFAREAAQAERALKPFLGDPTAFFVTLWPGNWGAGGARVSEWIVPTIAILCVAALTPRQPFLFRWRQTPAAPRPRAAGARNEWD